MFAPRRGQLIIASAAVSGRRSTWPQRDPVLGDPSTPLTLHKYLYANGDPIDTVDPSGHEGLAEQLVGAGIKQGLMGMLIGSPFRALKFALDLRAGIDIGQASEDALFGLAFDFGLGAALGVGGKVLEFLQPLARLRQVGQAVQRATSSVWNLAPFQRGLAIERMILGRLPSLSSVSNFPVIDDFVRGIATSIKSLDLTAKTYESASAMTGVLSKYASKLASFTGAAKGGLSVPGASIVQRVLLVAFEDGAATGPQMQALSQFTKDAATKWPNVKVVFQFVKG